MIHAYIVIPQIEWFLNPDEPSSVNKNTRKYHESFVFHSCVPKDQCQDGLIDIRGSGNGPVCNNKSLVCCHPENVVSSTPKELNKCQKHQQIGYRYSKLRKPFMCHQITFLYLDVYQKKFV